MKLFKRFLWQKEQDGYTVTDITTGKELRVRYSFGKYYIDGITTTDYYGQVVPKAMNKFEVMEYMKEATV